MQNNAKPIWVTDELSQEWIDCSPKQNQHASKPSSLRIPSSSRIPIPNRHSSVSSLNSLMRHHQSNSISSLNLLQPTIPRIPSLDASNSRIIHSPPSLKPSDPSIVLNSDETSNHHTPPWLKAAVDGMVNQVLGKRPTQLEKLFRNSSPPLPPQQPQDQQPSQNQVQQSAQDPEQPSPPANPNSPSPPRSNLLHPNAVATFSLHDSSNRVPSSSIHPSSAEHSGSFLPNIQFQFSVPRSHAPLISFEDPNQISIQSDPSPQSIIEYQAEEGVNRAYLSAPIPQGDHVGGLRFNVDSRLDQIIEVTEPSSSLRISNKSSPSRASSSNFGSLPSSFNPPSLPFAHRTPVLDAHGRIHRIKSDTLLSIQQKAQSHLDPLSTCNLPDNHSQISSCDQSDLSTSQTRFRFTYDTFTRKHLNRLTEEIHALSVNDASALCSGAPLKIKSILGSPGEELTDSNTSMGLAHSTPPIIMNPFSKHQPHIFHAGRTPFKPMTNLSQRLREEKRWMESFVEPSSYAADSLSPVVMRKTQRGLQESHDELETSHNLNRLEAQTGSSLCRSSKRIRLESPQPSSETRHRRLRDSVTLMNERKQRRRTPGVNRVHPMVVFKSSTDTAVTSNTPQGKPLASHIVVRDRLAEAKALMDRLRAKNTTGQVDPTAAPDLPKPEKKLLDHQIGSLDNDARASNTPAQIDSLGPEDSSSFSVRPKDLMLDPSEYPGTSNHEHPLRSVVDSQGKERIREGDKAVPQCNQPAGRGEKHPEPSLEWDISIDEGAPDNRDREEKDEEQREGAQDSVHRRLASTAAAFLRQTLGDVNAHHQSRHEKLTHPYGSSTASTLTNLAGTTASRRQFTTQPIFREPIGRVTHDACNQLTHSSSTIACTTASAPTPALTTATSTRQSSTSSHKYHQEAADYGKQPHPQKLGLMTIAPGDVEELLQNRRVGNMVFDSAIGKWVKVRSQSETGGMFNKATGNGNVDLEAVGEAGIQNEESTDEEDIFKDIESLNSKRESNSSGSGLMAEIDCNVQTNLTLESQNDEDNVETSSNINKNSPISNREKFKPKSVLKTANENLDDTPNPVVIPGPTEKSRWRMGPLRPGRSVSFQDGRKNGKIIGLVDEDETEEENELEQPQDVNEGQRKSLKESNLNHTVNSRKHQELKATVETKGNKQSSYHSISHHDRHPAIGPEHSFNQDENNHSILNQTSLILMNSAKKKVRRKSSSSSAMGTPNSSNNSLSTIPTQNQSPPSHVHSILSTENSKSNNHLISEYSFELNYSKLIKIITDFEPFEPFWNSIKVINLSNRSIDSVIRLNEILPSLDQIDLSSNQLNYLTGLPNTLRMLIVAKNQINELCSFNHLQDLVRLDLSENALTTLQQLSTLKHLRELKADGNLLTDFSGIDQLDCLVKLSLKGNRFKKINFESTNWNCMEVLNLDRNQICEINGLHSLKSVYLLNLDRNQIHSLTIAKLLPNLRVLRINENRLESLDVSKLVNLRTLYIDNNDLMEICGANQLRKLENLSVRDQRGGELSLPLKQVRDVKRIYLGGNPLPAAFPTSQFYNLTYLELAMCQCQSLPMDLANLIPNIRTLNLNYNFLKDLSPLKNLKRLERLTVVGSRIKTLDTKLLNVLESLVELELLDLRQNPLSASFYPPLLLKSTPSASIVASRNGEKSRATPHLDQYQIVTKEDDNWQSIDDRFRKSLPNEFYLKRMTYRSIITRTCNHESSNKLKCLDGIKINEVERKKMEKFLRGLSRKLDQKDQTSTSLNAQPEGTDKGEIQQVHNRHSRRIASAHSSTLHYTEQQGQPDIDVNSSSRRRDRQLSSASLLDQSNHLATIDRSRY